LDDEIVLHIYASILSNCVKWVIPPLDDPFYGNTEINKLPDTFMSTYCQILHGVKWGIPPMDNPNHFMEIQGQINYQTNLCQHTVKFCVG
jgi:hypothetical protein